MFTDIISTWENSLECGCKSAFMRLEADLRLHCNSQIL